MADQQDFERAWLEKFARCMDATVGGDIRERVMVGSEYLTMETERAEVIAWTQQALERLGTLADDTAQRRVLTGCACRYPKSELQEVRRAYEATGDVDQVLQILQQKFEVFLKEGLHLDDALIAEIVRCGWGVAGIREGNTIIATKIPKSGYLVAYMEEPDPSKQRAYYCHCPRIRKALEMGALIPPVYCYCGAGYYQGIWEEILQQPVEVEVLESVLDGGDVCKVAVQLPVEV